MKNFQPIDLTSCTSMGPQFMIQTVQYSCINGKYQDSFISEFFMDFEKFVSFSKNPNTSKTVGCTHLHIENGDFEF